MRLVFAVLLLPLNFVRAAASSESSLKRGRRVALKSSAARQEKARGLLEEYGGLLPATTRAQAASILDRHTAAMHRVEEAYARGEGESPKWGTLSCFGGGGRPDDDDDDDDDGLNNDVEQC